MSRYGDLMGGITSSTEVVPPAPVDTAPASVEPDEEVNLNTMTKIELEEYGRTIGIELDRRYSKDKLIEQLYEKLAEI
tara:strand:+ start:62 stop:295 length:234 start_codon:yes stop_codon:yes gene_type:complete